ncbi:MAG: hypothetical protein RR590_00030 [Hungatella sp.]
MLRNLLMKLRSVPKKRKKLLRNAAILTICALLFAIYMQRGSREELNNVVASVWYEDRLYGIDCFGGTNTFFSCDADGKNSQSIVFGTPGTNVVQIGEDVFIGEDGRCYVRYEQYDETSENKVMVAVGNFEKGILEEIREIPPSEAHALGIYKSHQLLDGSTWYVDREGSVWRRDSDGVETCLFLNDGQTMDSANAAYCFGNDSLYFQQTKDSMIYKIPYATGVLEESDLGITVKASGGNGRLYQLAQMEDGTFTAGFRESNGSRLLPVVLKEGNRQIEKLYPTLEEQVKRVIRDTAFLMGGILLLYLLYTGISHLFGGIIPTSLKLFCSAGVVIVVGSQMLNLLVWVVFDDQIIAKEELRMYHDTSTIEGLVQSWVPVTDAEQMNQRFVQEITDFGEITLASGEVFDIEKKSLGTIATREINYDLFLKYKDDFYLVDTNPLYCTPSSYANGGKDSAIMKECAATGESIIFSNTDSMWGESTVIYNPVVAEDGTVYAFIRGLSNTSVTIREAEESKQTVVRWVYLFLGWILLILTATAVVLMQPLLKLRRFAEGVEKGREVRWNKKNGVSEVSQISHFFVRMLESIEVHIKKVSRLKQAYEPFVPENIISMFRGTDIIDIHAGEKTEVRAVIAVLESGELRKKKSWKNDSDQFCILNQMYRLISDNIEEAGGIIERFTEAGAVVIFRDEGEERRNQKVLHAVGKTIEELNAAKIGFEDTICYFGGGVAIGELLLGVIGTEDRMEVMMVSPYTRAALSLNHDSCQYKAGILMTKSAAQEAQKAGEGDNIRLFGYREKDHGELADEEIYEFFLPLGEEQSRLRALTRDDYEAGLRHLKESRFREARSCFERVLRQNRNDLAVKRLFRLCDKKMDL